MLFERLFVYINYGIRHNLLQWLSEHPVYWRNILSSLFTDLPSCRGQGTRTTASFRSGGCVQYTFNQVLFERLFVYINYGIRHNLLQWLQFCLDSLLRVDLKCQGPCTVTLLPHLSCRYSLFPFFRIMLPHFIFSLQKCTFVVASLPWSRFFTTQYSDCWPPQTLYVTYSTSTNTNQPTHLVPSNK